MAVLIPPITVEDVKQVRAELDCSILTAAKVTAQRRALELIDKLELDIGMEPQNRSLTPDEQLQITCFILRYLVERA